MKTAIVMEINAGSALVMKTGGEFATLPAQPGWQKGDVVVIAEKKRSFKAFYAAAACLAMILLGSFGGYQLYFTETALVSIDINPSIELRLNRFERVFASASFNEDGQALLAAVKPNGMRVDKALAMLLQSAALQPYLESNDYLAITVSGNEQWEQQIQAQAQELTSPYQLQLSCRSTDPETVAAAHAHGMTPGRYLAFLELQTLDPEADIADYSDCGVGQIQQEIEAHHQNRHGQSEEHGGPGWGSDANPQADDEARHPAENGGPGHKPQNGADDGAAPTGGSGQAGSEASGKHGQSSGQGQGGAHDSNKHGSGQSGSSQGGSEPDASEPSSSESSGSTSSSSEPDASEPDANEPDASESSGSGSGSSESSGSGSGASESSGSGSSGGASSGSGSGSGASSGSGSGGDESSGSGSGSGESGSGSGGGASSGSGSGDGQGGGAHGKGHD